MQIKVNVGQLTGREFAAIVQNEFEKHNEGLGSLSYGELARACGLNRRTLSLLLTSEDGCAPPNPSLKTMRLVLYTLGFDVRAPESDVIPHLRDKGAFRDELHGQERARKDLCAADIGANE